MIVPSLSVIVLIHNIYLLGQPNLLLLALVLGAFGCLRLGRELSAGALVATAAAIKAFPLLILGYLVYRRMWRASAATLAVLAAWLLIAPLPFRTPAQAVDDLRSGRRGMLFTYNTHGIAQRPLRSYSYKNQSIMAVMHRLLRDVPADGESVLSRRARLAESGPRPRGGAGSGHRSPELPQAAPACRQQGGASRLDRGRGRRTPRPAPRWDEAIQGAEPALRAAWRVNVLDLEFPNGDGDHPGGDAGPVPVRRGRDAAAAGPHPRDRRDRVRPGHPADGDLLAACRSTMPMSGSCTRSRWPCTGSRASRRMRRGTGSRSAGWPRCS